MNSTTASSLENESVATTSTPSMTTTMITSTSIETFTTDTTTTTTSSWATTTETTWDMDTTTLYDAIQETLSTTESVYMVTEATTDTTTAIQEITGGLFSSYVSNSALVTDLATVTDLPSSTPSSTCTPSCSQEHSLSVTQIGGIVGGIAIFLILCGLFIFCKRERNVKSKESRVSQYVYHQDMKEATFSQEDQAHRTVIDVPDTAYHQNYVPTSLYPRRDSPQTSFATTTVIDHQSQGQSVGKSSMELDTDDYTHSAMDIFNGQQGLYRPSLNESILLDLRQDRRESTLDPHLLLDKKKPLWDDQI